MRKSTPQLAQDKMQIATKPNGEKQPFRLRETQAEARETEAQTGAGTALLFLRTSSTQSLDTINKLPNCDLYDPSEGQDGIEE